MIHVHNQNRVVAFRRWDDGEHFLVLASLNDQPFSSGYLFSHPRVANLRWKEIFNSDASRYGGENMGNRGGTLLAGDAGLDAVVSANCVVVFQQVP